MAAGVLSRIWDEWSYTSISPYVYFAWCLSTRDNFLPFAYINCIPQFSISQLTQILNNHAVTWQMTCPQYKLWVCSCHCIWKTCELQQKQVVTFSHDEPIVSFSCQSNLSVRVNYFNACKVHDKQEVAWTYTSYIIYSMWPRRSIIMSQYWRVSSLSSGMGEAMLGHVCKRNYHLITGKYGHSSCRLCVIRGRKRLACLASARPC
jgi:hypothetical protein